jgi:arylsulfatase A-like enzyme
MIRWPGRVRAGSQCHEAVTSTDFYPTFLEAAGLPLMPEQHCDGVSLLPALEEKGSLNREAIYWHYPHYANQGGTPAASMVMGEWKLIEFFEDNSLELYNLKEDVSETTTVAVQHPDLVRKMHAMLKAWQSDIEAKIPEPNPEYEAKLKRPLVANNAHV